MSLRTSKSKGLKRILKDPKPGLGFPTSYVAFLCSENYGER